MLKTWIIRVLTTLMTLCVMWMIYSFSMEPAEDSDTTSGWISQTLADVIRPGWRNLEPEEKENFYNSVQHVVRKCAHFTEFALLGFSLRLCLESWFGFEKELNPLGWVGGSIYALQDEMHQLSVNGRSSQWPDVFIDSGGVLCGVLLAALLLRRFRKKQAEEQEKQEPEGQ